MLKFYCNINNVLEIVSYKEIEDGSHEVLWIDLFNPTKQDKKILYHLLGINLPDRKKMDEIEISNRFYQKNNNIYITGNFFSRNQNIEPITFILTNKTIITLRYDDFSFFEYFFLLEKNNTSKPYSYVRLFIDFLEASISQMADKLEESERLIDKNTQTIFRSHSLEKGNHRKINFKNIIYDIGKNGDLISKTNETLLSTNRILKFFLSIKSLKFSKDDSRKLKILQNDITPLSDHASFLANKVNFLLDASLGIINVEQNNIIKIVSVAALVFFPPTLIASIYGMNFAVFPELQWSFGYPLALLLMVLSGLLPYSYFKYKEWI
jgi:magnesium transporter